MIYHDGKNHPERMVAYDPGDPGRRWVAEIAADYQTRGEIGYRVSYEERYAGTDWRRISSDPVPWREDDLLNEFMENEMELEVMR